MDYQLTPNCFARWNSLGGVTPQCFPITKSTVYLHYTGDIQTAIHANTGDCEYAMGRVRDICHGKNGQTRGGLVHV